MAVLREPPLGAQATVRGAPQPGFPTEPNTTAEIDGRLVLWLGPEEWLVLGGVEGDFPGADAAVDVSANRVAFELSGADAIRVLARGCSLDLERMEPGRCAQTLLSRAPVILSRAGVERWTVLVRRSYADYVRAWLVDALEGAAS